MNQKIQEKKKVEPFQNKIGKPTEKEYELLYWLRTRFRYGEVTIEVRDGQPYRIVKAYETHEL